MVSLYSLDISRLSNLAQTSHLESISQANIIVSAKGVIFLNPN